MTVNLLQAQSFVRYVAKTKSNSAVFGSQSKNLPTWSLEIEAGIVRVIDLRDAKLDQSAFGVFHVLCLDFQPCGFQVIFLGKHISLLAIEDAKNERVGEAEEVEVPGRS